MSKYQLFDTLDPATEAALRSSIGRWGVLVPIVKDQHGNIIDGHHRSRIADELGVEFRVDVRDVADDDEAQAIARTLNTDRRHLDAEMRRQVVAELRSEGHSLRAIAGAVGTSLGTVQRDLAAVSTDTAPSTVIGSDGKRYPSTRPKAEPAAEVLEQAEPERSFDDVIVEAEAIADNADDPVIGAIEAVESRRIPKPVPKPTVADGIPPHPATYPQAVLDIFAEFVQPDDVVLDPFGGVGGIHQLRQMVECTTVAIELEPEWAAASPHTICGDARRAAELVGGQRFNVIATSPAYGNRLADDYVASDPQARRSYAIDLGRSLTDGNGAGMHYASNGEYEQLHYEVWWQAMTLLEPGGLFLLNCKDFQRAGKVMPVTGWHMAVLSDFGLVAIDLRTLPAAGLPFTTAKPLSELVVVFQKRYVKAEMYGS